ncbi:MAG: TetR/AcrR family transcriptional regulator [Alphaproteobacteria bacterium]
MDNVKRRERTARTSQKPRPRNPAATREALMTAAARIFNREGYFATDTNAIARAAGYAPASFYKHFADKAAILLAVYEDYVRREWAGLEAAMAGETVLQKRLRRALGFIIGFHGEWSAFRTTLRAVARIEPAVAEALKASRARQIGYLAAATGLSAQRHRATLLMILGIVERLAETVQDAEATSPPIRREVLLEEAERALLALVERK